jgi:DNA polymerase-3 subunit delta
MKFADLKPTLKTTLAPIYQIHGADLFLVNKAIDLVITASKADKDLDISRLDETAGQSTITSECRTISFLGGKRVVIVKPFTQDISEYIKNPNPDCILVLVSTDEKPTLLKGVQPIDCNPMSPDLLVKLVANQLVKYNKKITPDAAQLLCSYCANLYSRIDGEINKIANYFTELEVITANEINQIVTKTTEYQVYELANAICAGNVERAEQVLTTLQNMGTDDYAIFANVVSSLRRIYYSLSTQSPNEAVAAVLGCSPYAVQYARRDYRHLAHKIAKLYDHALDLEYKIKSGKISVHNAVVLCYSFSV